MAKKSAGRKRTSTPAARKTSSRKAPASSTSRKATSRKTSSGSGTRSRAARSTRPATPPQRRSASFSPASLAEVRGATLRRDVGGVRLEAGPAGEGRVKRMVYPAGYQWSRDTKPHVDTDYCMHAHVGFLVQGRIDVEYADGCVEVYQAPQIVAVAPGHDGRVVGSESAILIEFDFEGDTINRLGMPTEHRHDGEE